MRSQSITTPPGSDPCRCALDGDERRRILLDARSGLHHGCGLSPAAQQAAGLERARVAARHVGGELEERPRRRRGLFVRESVSLLALLIAVPGTERIDDRSDIQARAAEARFAEADTGIDRDAEKNLHAHIVLSRTSLANRRPVRRC